MSVELKPVEQQVVVITGASSGIGLATARAFAGRGARLVLVARNAEALQDLVHEIEGEGGRALAVAADVSKQDEVERVAQTALSTFGGFDTWINNAGVAIYGAIEDVPVEDQRHLFDTNYWGVVYGSLAAARHLKRRGGAIINTGSVLSDRAMIYQAPYSAAKHAVKGFTDGLRMELEAAGAPISVTLVKPAAIDTPYMEHARNYMDAPGLKNPPPAYDPEVVAKAMVFAAENPKRELTVGFGGWMVSALGSLFPRLTDFAMEAMGRQTQTTGDTGRQERRDNLYEAREDYAERSSLPGGSRKSSFFLEAQMRPLTTMLVLAGVGVAAARFLRGSGGSSSRRSERQARTPGYRPSHHTVGNGHDRVETGPGLYGRSPRPLHERRVVSH